MGSVEETRNLRLIAEILPSRERGRKRIILRCTSLLAFPLEPLRGLHEQTVELGAYVEALPTEKSVA